MPLDYPGSATTFGKLRHDLPASQMFMSAEPSSALENEAPAPTAAGTKTGVEFQQFHQVQYRPLPIEIFATSAATSAGSLQRRRARSASRWRAAGAVEDAVGLAEGDGVADGDRSCTVDEGADEDASPRASHPPHAGTEMVDTMPPKTLMFPPACRRL